MYETMVRGHFERMDFSVPLVRSGIRYMANAPREVQLTLGNIFRPFSWLIWLAILGTTLLLCLYFHVAHALYQGLEGTSVLPEASAVNFYLYGLCKITEPEPLPWFRRASGGTMSVTLWSIFALAVTMFYQSNLRAFMVTKQYEKPMVTLQDVLDRGENIWMIKSAFVLQ